MKTLTTLITSLLAASTALAANTAQWKSRNIYFALTDRIARGGDGADNNACGNLGNYCGGTFKGLESKLDYIRGMGFDAIWITPVVESKLLPLCPEPCSLLGPAPPPEPSRYQSHF